MAYLACCNQFITVFFVTKIKTFGTSFTLTFHPSLDTSNCIISRRFAFSVLHKQSKLNVLSHFALFAERCYVSLAKRIVFKLQKK